jgi:hypothetical protein
MQTLHGSNDYAMENYKMIPTMRRAGKFSEIKQATDAKHRHSVAHVSSAANHFNMIEFIRQPRNDSTFLLALVR